MEIKNAQDGSTLTLTVSGRLDTTTAPQLEAVLKRSINGITSLIFDFTDLEYISSAGLRVLLAAAKVMAKQGTMSIQHPNETVNEVFEVTGMDSFLNIVK